MHKCPHPACERQVKVSELACRSHWFTLPKPLRDRIWSAYRAKRVGTLGADAAHRQALAEATHFWTERQQVGA